MCDRTTIARTPVVLHAKRLTGQTPSQILPSPKLTLEAFLAGNRWVAQLSSSDDEKVQL